MGIGNPLPYTVLFMTIKINQINLIYTCLWQTQFFISPYVQFLLK